VVSRASRSSRLGGAGRLLLDTRGLTDACSLPCTAPGDGRCGAFFDTCPPSPGTCGLLLTPRGPAHVSDLRGRV